MTSAIAAMATIAALRNAVDLANLVAAPYDAGHRPFNIAATTFKLDLIKGDAVTTWPDLLGITTIIEIDIPEPEIIGFTSDGLPASPNGLAFSLAVIVAIVVVTVVAIARVADRTVAAIAIAKMQAAIASLYGNASGHSFLRRAMVGQGWRCEEQWRRKGKRGCSRFHDTIYHEANKSQALATQPERAIRAAFICINGCSNIAISSDQGQAVANFSGLRSWPNMKMGIDMRLFTLGAAAFAVSLTATAEDTSRDDHLITSLTQSDMRFIAESMDHTVRRDLDDTVGVLAFYTEGADDQELVYAMQGKACQDDTGCLGMEIFIIFEGDFTAEDANLINRRWSAIKATETDGSLFLTRYLILDDGQTMGNVRTNVLNALAIAEQIQDEQAAVIQAEETHPSLENIDFGEDAGDYANDGACDDARFEEDGDDWTYQRAHVLRDATDCRTLYAEGTITLFLDFGDNSGEYANDDTCDDNRFTGEGRSILETDSHVKRDAVDCIVAYRAGTIDRP